MTLGRELLRCFSEVRGIPEQDIVGKSRLAPLVAARREFCILARAEGIGSVLIGKLINLSYSTVRANIRSDVRRRKAEYHRRRKEERKASVA